MTSGNRPILVGVLLAAGRGRRLGGSKQLRPWPPGAGRRPLVAAAFDAIADACTRMIVVLDHDAGGVAAALLPRRYRSVRGFADGELIESVRVGLKAALDEGRASAATGILLHLADHPEVAASTLATIVAAHAAAPDVVVIPTYDGRGGHPVLIPPYRVEGIDACPSEGGLREHWRRDPGACCRIPVDDPGVTRAIDEPADYHG